jgi:predicted AAA+ superfamily ATPase
VIDYYWEKRGWEAYDKHLGLLTSMPFQRPAPFIPKTKGLYIIRGPRQVGKTSWLKQVLSHYAEQEKCFYLSCEVIDSYRELLELLQSLRVRAIILLDEVSFIPEWDSAIKHFVDSGINFILMLTGSHAYDLKRGADRMPGRFDGGGEFELFPMQFDEFVAMRKQAGWSLSSRLEELRAYFRVGGFPRAVAEAGADGITPLEVKWSPVATNLSKVYLHCSVPWKKVWTHGSFLEDLPPRS